ncbi:MAG: pyridoxamine 5'-phosphate oxidase [Candidatus Eremiobacteraeota bacterium]|nr:pyridoxamine 5'-phosphate oxidase [Candidatus Eremiobacteraeota bacterium]
MESSRAAYASGAELNESTALHNPIEQLREWLELAYATPSIQEANAMCVATAQSDGTVSARMVLLRGLDERGLVFFTSYGSRKGRQIAENPRAAVTFYWPPIHRQVRVEGAVSQLPEDESDAYFATRPRGHQLSAWASEQGEPVEGREVLDERLVHFSERFDGEEVPRPHSWGGYLIAPDRFEFWQGRENRMHDRLEYIREGREWKVARLQP